MNSRGIVWSKEDREPFVEAYQCRVDSVGDYMENLVDVWHDYAGDWLIAGEDIRLYDFLGLEEDEIDPWIRDGTVPFRIIRMWNLGNY